jgi:adenosylmethionine-8-amino-7-oxononanoate aminotransferase
MSEHPCVGEVRGEGFFWAVELVAQRETRVALTEEQWRYLMVEVLPLALSETELIVRPDDRGGTMLVLAPPLVADDAVLGELFDRLDTVLGKVDAYLI